VIPPGAVREGASYLFFLSGIDDALSAELMIDDVPIEALRSQDPHVALWRWKPGFHVGVVEVVLRVPGLGTPRFEITTDPDLRKLTRDDFDVMVREILEDTFALFSLSAFRIGIARHIGNQRPPLARLEFLRSRADKIVSTIAAIGRSPRHFLRAEQATVLAHRAVRVSGLELIKSFRSGRIRVETAKPSRLPAMLKGRLPSKITMRQRRNSVDIPEHRQIKACLKAWSVWLSSAADLLSKTANSDDPEVVTTAAAWAVRTRRIARRLHVASTAGFMADVGEAPALLHMTSLFRNDPVYQRFYKLWQDMNLGLAALHGDFLQMPLARTYQLYELWSFLRLLRAAIDEYGSADVDLSNLFINEVAGSVTIGTGAITVPIGADQMLCFQRRYQEYWVESSREGSFSRTMIPDIVFSGPSSSEVARRVIVFDAKYRINDGLNDALNSIHMYRDALVKETENSRTEGLVRAAYLLTPHMPAGLTPDFKETAVPGRLFHPHYRKNFRFGAVTLRPGMSAEDLRICLKTVVMDAEA
jgi:hypothetical protein